MAETDSPRDERAAETNTTEAAVATETEGRSILGTARIAGFYLVVLATIGLFVFMLGELLQFAFLGWTAQGADVLGPHRFHDTVFATMMGVALLGLVIQLYRPADKFVGVLGYLVVVGIIGAIFGAIGSEDVMLAAIFGGLGLVIAVLHPTSGSIRRPRLANRFDRVVLGLVAVIPLVVYFADQFTLQATGDPTNDHVVFGHYAAMATLAGSILVLSLVAVFAPVGWRLAAVGAGLLALVWGAASVAFPAQESSGGPCGARSQSSGPSRSSRPPSTPTAMSCRATCPSWRRPSRHRALALARCKPAHNGSQPVTVVFSECRCVLVLSDWAEKSLVESTAQDVESLFRSGDPSV